MPTNDEIARKHAENIMARVNDTWPRTLNIDVLVDEIGKAIHAAAKPSWPPTVMVLSRPEDCSPHFIAPDGTVQFP